MRSRRRTYPETPPGWAVIGGESVGPFPTVVLYRRGDGSPARWRSRYHRKHASRLSRLPAGPAAPRWWAPARGSWWIGILFAIGSTCFLVAALPGVAGLLGSGADGVVFFVGSIFFTAAAALQHAEAINADRGLAGPDRRERLKLLSFEPARIDWWSTLIQLVGTVLFNLNTFDAMLAGLSAEREDLLVWAPDVVGSLCFLLASHLALAEVCGRLVCWRGRSLEWRIGVANIAGSAAFGIAAAASYVVPASGDALDLAAANASTALGGLAFLIGSVLLLREGAAPPAPLSGVGAPPGAEGGAPLIPAN